MILKKIGWRGRLNKDDAIEIRAAAVNGIDGDRKRSRNRGLMAVSMVCGVPFISIPNENHMKSQKLNSGLIRVSEMAIRKEKTRVLLLSLLPWF